MVRSLSLSLVVFVLGGAHPAQSQGIFNFDKSIVFRSGNIQVKRGIHYRVDDESIAYYSILRDSINFGICYEEARFRRMPGTYYHPQGPLGIAFQRFNRWPMSPNTFHADVRIAASLVGQAPSASMTAFPLEQLATTWSEPPIAVIGMEAGTPAAYARPFQFIDFYEPNKVVIALHAREETDRFFHFIPDARTRGANVRVFAGAPREQLAKAPRGFYKLIILESCSGENGEKIFIELLTKEGIALCMDRLADGGILCVHTSHRFLSLPPILAAIGDELKLEVRRGHDLAPGAKLDRNAFAEIGHYTSEWVLLSRSKELLDDTCKTPREYEQMLRRAKENQEAYWTTPKRVDQVWTDKGPNLMHGVLRGHPFTMRYSATVGRVFETLAGLSQKVGLGGTVGRYLNEWERLSPETEQRMVRDQLKDHPELEKLWK